ncbi:uncharacterized protein [Spinacia oleracea]|uniref:Reverse transcriptase domain-containing protein n=1 Tax=Spinacia oleracea TaxID=3562 RepID=A0ABM3QZB3_SPIOL|nr:uncharacterized protein LOC130463519 [Spinacia oleracea]
MLVALKFPPHFTIIIMQCVRSPKFSSAINGSLHGFFEGKRGLRQGDPLSPLLFVLCIEYLSRILKVVGEKEEFQFHPRCKVSKLNHLCFADDLILCCKGDFRSVYLMMQGFKLFSNTTGLQASPSKTSVYCTGMPETEVQRILVMTGFSKGSFPFRYLGLPICSKKIRVGECEKIVENMCARIKIWSSRNMSFAGRLTLIMVLPKGVYNTVNAICRNFLWKGTIDAIGPAMGKHVWMIATKKDNMWVRWVNNVYIKDGSWWDYSPKVCDSWYWKSICTVKDLMKNYLSETQLISITKYTIKEAYCCLAPVLCKVPWTNAVWDRLSLPKNRFITWLAMLERLNTKDRLLKIGVSADNCTTKIGMQNAPKLLSATFQWIFSRRITKFRRGVYSTLVMSVAYHIWIERNNATWNSQVRCIDKVCSSILQNVYNRVNGVMPKEISNRDHIWFSTLFAG